MQQKRGCLKRAALFTLGTYVKRDARASFHLQCTLLAPKVDRKALSCTGINVVLDQLILMLSALRIRKDPSPVITLDCPSGH